MPRFTVPLSEFRVVKYRGKKRHAISKAAFDSFNIKVLGLGDVSAPSEPTDAIAAVFDFGGFTNFCKQIEPHLSVPFYLNAFLTWLMRQLREEVLLAELKRECGFGVRCRFLSSFWAMVFSYCGIAMR